MHNIPVKFKRGDLVQFKCIPLGKEEPEMIVGTVEIVDGDGYFFDNSQPYYDIMVNHGDQVPALYKHIAQSSISPYLG